MEKPCYNKPEKGANVSDGDHGTDDGGGDVMFYVVRSRTRVPSWVEGTRSAAFGVRPCLDLFCAFELAMELHNNYRRKSPTLVTKEE